MIGANQSANEVAADRMANLWVPHGSPHDGDDRDGLGQNALTCPPDPLRWLQGTLIYEIR